MNSNRSKAQVEQELAEAERNRVAVEKLIEQNAGKKKALALFGQSLDRLNASIFALKAELDELKEGGR